MREPARQAMEWLAAAACDPRECKRQWRSEAGVAMLACGRFWDVLSVPENLGTPTLDTLLRMSRPPGPVLTDTSSRRVGFFLPPDPGGRWIGRDVRYLGRGAWVAAPAPYQAGGRLRWLVPPDGLGTLFGPAAVELALQHGLAFLAAQAEAERRCPTCGSPTPAAARDGVRAD
ncbi:bifunctional DNA primase/polymerase [Streptomyces sp. NPDC093094]|uniref:bifunctional DNA primase/polymerase n=1 Tax=Streptomyces sp. NPDC093094 TaxID=3366026 RepID=UPI0038036234